MTSSMRDDLDLSSEDTVFVEEIERAYQPPAMNAARRTAFDARLEERLQEREPRSFWPAAAMGMASAAAIGALALWFNVTSPIETTEVASTETLEDALLVLIEPADRIGRDDSLPEDYEAIASLFLEGA